MSTSTAVEVPRSRAPRLVAMAATAVLAVVLGVFGSVGVLIDPLATELGAPREQLVLLFAAALAVHTLAARHAGRALDRFGPRPLLVLAGAGTAIGLLTLAGAGSAPLAVAGYGLGLGLASACSWVATAGAVGAAFRGRRATAMGVLTAGPAAGGAVLAPAVTAAVQHHGARPTCALLAVVGAVTCGAGAAVLRDRPDSTAAAATGGAAPDLRPVVAAAVLMGLVVFLPLVHGVAAATGLGLSAAESAVVLTVISLASAATRIATGGLTRIGPLDRLYRAAHLVIAAGFGLWALASPAANPFLLLLAAGALFGAGYGAWLAVGPAWLATVCPPAGLGRALGTLAAGIGVGGVAGPTLAAPLLAAAPTALWLGSAAVALLAAHTLRAGSPTRSTDLIIHQHQETR